MPRTRRLRGMTLMELVVAMAILSITMTGTVTLLMVSVRRAQRDAERAVALSDMETTAVFLRVVPTEALRRADGDAPPVDVRLYGSTGGGAPHLREQRIRVYREDAKGRLEPMALPAVDAASAGAAPSPPGPPETFVIECAWIGHDGEPNTERFSCLRMR